ncbi:hypothetical protein Syn7803C17_144 [Synechococcus phage ACG-2014f]|uniref:HNH nuclease domain-containing protein n=1 Tax=Synechococcus phage ACG-2014f TaxID=1493511 RepID=A0A0E3HQH9_9CAUD|nr:hypothetical protein Syn7803US50_147 [Synechococcus phage ACG-2014f]AIX42648.1 hypothetical protein Syn7803C17_144 [Synechococcus phage ACG-2014f]
MRLSQKRRQEAIAEGRKYYISATSCRKCGCIVKYVSTYGCHFCVKQSGYKKLMSGALEKYQTPETTNKRLKRWRENNPEKYREQWLRDESVNARAAKRRATKRNQTPNLTPDEEERIRQIYQECGIMTEQTGVPHHVDHIVPISRGGLHHPDNLQILTAHENQSKGAKLEWH